MLKIENIDTIIRADGYKAQVKLVHMTDGAHPQRTYDIVFEHKDRPGREFFLTIDREAGGHNDFLTIGQSEYPISFWELTGPHNQSMSFSIWEENLKTSKLFLGFLDTIIQHYTTE